MTSELNTQNMTAGELIALANSLRDQAAEKRQAERKAELAERRAKEAAEKQEHYDEMLLGIGQPVYGLNGKQHAVVYAAAWERGHSSGYGEVETHYDEMAALARQILDAA